MARFVADIFPTDFAISLGESCGLIPEHDKTDPFNQTSIAEAQKKLATFQHMVIGGVDFKEALIAYHGKEITEEQEMVLRVVEKSTKPFLYGHLAELLLKKTENGSSSSVELLLREIMNAREDEKIDQEKARGLVVNIIQSENKV